MIHTDFTHYVQDRLHRYREQLRYQQSLPPATDIPNASERDAVKRELQACIGELVHLLERLETSHEVREP